ncbi:MAG: DUF2200 domain-containing protein [Flavobacteriales bacterium]|nr:DUF2200 domain-containing protein [Flavobacteriales bacterium]
MPAPTEAHHRRIAEMTFGSVYPCYLEKVEKKGRTKEELHAVLTWLTGFSEVDLDAHIKSGNCFAEFFAKAALNPLSSEVKGVICGYRIEDLDNPLTRKVRILDKMVDELAKGRALNRILRTAP